MRWLAAGGFIVTGVVAVPDSVGETGATEYHSKPPIYVISARQSLGPSDRKSWRLGSYSEVPQMAATYWTLVAFLRYCRHILDFSAREHSGE